MKSGGSLLFLLFLSAAVGAYQGRHGALDSGGGKMVGGGMQTTGVVGVQTSGVSGSTANEHLEGFLALFGQPLLSADAVSLAFGVVAAGSDQLLSLTLTNYGGVGLLLSNISFSSGGGAFTLEGPGESEVVSPGASAVWDVHFSPEAEGAAHDTLVASTNDPFRPEWRVPLSGTGAQSAPVLVWSADSLEFGPVPLGDDLALELTVQNAGEGTIAVGPLTTTDPSFTVAPDTLSLPPGEEETLSVLFSPLRADVFRDTLWITSEDAAVGGPGAVLLKGSVPSELLVVEPESGVLFFRATAGGPPPPEQRITITNEGGEPLAWRAETDVPEWVLLQASSGSASRGEQDHIDITIDVSSVSVGAHGALVLLWDEAKPLSPPDTVRIALVMDAFGVTVERSEDVVPRGAPLTIDAYATLAPDSGRVYFRGVGEPGFASLAMQREGPKGLTITLPGSLFDVRGLEYYVTVRSGGNSVQKPLVPSELPERVAVSVQDYASPPVASMRHTMISVPLATGGAKPGDIFPADLGPFSPDRWRLGRWSEALARYLEYPEQMGVSLDAGTGFWLIVRNGAIYSVRGISVFPDAGDTTFTIPLDGMDGAACWNQIGTPFAFHVFWSDCLVRDGKDRVLPVIAAADSGLLEHTPYAYRYDEKGGFYEEASFLEPWEGYFVNNLSGGPLDLLVPAREGPVTKKPASSSAPDPASGEWEVTLAGGTGGAFSGAVTFGARQGSREGWDRRDRYLPPPAPGASARFALLPRGPMPVAGKLRADLRAPGEGVTRWTLSVEAPEGEEVFLAVTGGAILPTGTAALLVDETAGICRVLETGLELSFRSDGRSKTFAVVAGPAAALGAEGFEPAAPAPAFALAAAYPNPSRGLSTVRFSLPASGRIQLQVFNVAGRRVRALADGVWPAGDHALEWDGRDENGRHSAPGIYFFRLEYGNEVQTRRTVLFR